MQPVLTWEDISVQMLDFIQQHFPYAWDLRDEFVTATWETIYMLLVSMVIGGLIGLVMGVIMTITGKGGILENRIIYRILDILSLIHI